MHVGLAPSPPDRIDPCAVDFSERALPFGRLIAQVRPKLAPPPTSPPSGTTTERRLRTSGTQQLDQASVFASLPPQSTDDVLRESERGFQRLLEAMQLPAMILGNRASILFANEFLASLLGYSREHLQSKTLYDLVSVRDRTGAAREFNERLRRGDIDQQFEIELQTSRGDERIVTWNSTILHDEAGDGVAVVSIGIDVTDQRDEAAQRLHEALHDGLTGLPNRTLFIERLETAMGRAHRHERYRYGVLFVDLDRFKVINDSFGHRMGDRLLIEASGVLRRCVEPQDTVARLGGDEFAIVLDDLPDDDYPSRVAQRIHDAFATPITLEDNDAFTTASIGIALGTREYDAPEDILRDADTAMNRAKAKGKARHEVFDPSMHQKLVATLHLETDLRRAVERNELFLVYQPIVSMRDRSVVGFEALVRWQHPTRGLVSPMDFIPLAEETGLIVPIGLWVLREACRQIAEWTASSPEPLYVSVNLSSRQLSVSTLVSDVMAVLEEFRLPPSRLKLEITESGLMENTESAAQILRNFREAGILISIDDFGTGYSSLSYLVRFPIDTLKIDRSFVKAMSDGGNDNLELIRAIVTLARNLGMEVVAEGVETEDQRIRLEALGCPLAQGYFFARPLSVADALAVVDTRRVPENRPRT